jgi:hypothetical protein
MDSIRDSIGVLQISASSSQTSLRTTIFERKCVSEFLSDRLDFFYLIAHEFNNKIKKQIELIGEELSYLFLFEMLERNDGV